MSSKIKFTDLTNNSSLVDVDLNEAADVNGGLSPDYRLAAIYPLLGSDRRMTTIRELKGHIDLNRLS